MVLGFGLEALVELVQQHGVLAVVIGALIEEIIVPIPSPVIPMAAGAIIVQSQQLLPALVEIVLYIAIPASVASVLSSYFVYGIAYYGGKPVIEKWGRFLDLEWEEIKQLERHFGHERTKHYVFLFRALPIVPLSMISGAAGLFRMNWKEYGIWSFMGMMPRNISLALIGWYFRDDFLRFASHIDTLSTAVAVLTVVLIGGFLVYRKLDHLSRKHVLKTR